MRNRKFEFVNPSETNLRQAYRRVTNGKPMRTVDLNRLFDMATLYPKGGEFMTADNVSLEWNGEENAFVVVGTW